MQGATKIIPYVNGLLVIVGGGEVDLNLLKNLRKDGAVVVCADGGANFCAVAKIVPDAIIGDMDSLADRGVCEQKTIVHEIGEQETTDFEKCLYSVEAHTTICLGVSGKRLDHTLAALDVLVRYCAGRRLAIVSKTELVLAVVGRFEFVAKANARVSIHPSGPIRFATSEGLEFPLAGVELAPGKRTGTSNRAMSGAFEIVPQAGESSPYLVIMDKKYLGKWLEGEVI